MSKLSNLISRIVTKKNGIKLTDVYSYLKGKAEELEIEVSMQLCKDAATELFTEGKIDLVEYRLPGENEKPRMFLLPVGCTVVHGDDSESDTDADEDKVFEEMTDAGEEQMLLSSDMFEAIHVVSTDAFLSTPSTEQAQAEYLRLLGLGQAPRLFGAIPISLSVTVSYLPPTPTPLEVDSVNEDAVGSAEAPQTGDANVPQTPAPEAKA